MGEGEWEWGKRKRKCDKDRRWMEGGGVGGE